MPEQKQNRRFTVGGGKWQGLNFATEAERLAYAPLQTQVNWIAFQEDTREYFVLDQVIPGSPNLAIWQPVSSPAPGALLTAPNINLTILTSGGEFLYLNSTAAPITVQLPANAKDGATFWAYDGGAANQTLFTAAGPPVVNVNSIGATQTYRTVKLVFFAATPLWVGAPGF